MARPSEDDVFIRPPQLSAAPPRPHEKDRNANELVGNPQHYLPQPRRNIVPEIATRRTAVVRRLKVGCRPPRLHVQTIDPPFGEPRTFDVVLIRLAPLAARQFSFRAVRRFYFGCCDLPLELISKRGADIPVCRQTRMFAPLAMVLKPLLRTWMAVCVMLMAARAQAGGGPENVFVVVNA